MFRRRRPLLGAAMIGGAAYAGHRAGQNAAYAEQQEADQNAQIQALQAQQMQQAQAMAPPPAAPAAAPVDDMVSKIKQLQELKDQGILTDAEFQAAKTKVISG
ncbi:MAG TPA: SHOCT domain-containing protein [Gaiellaceae bacterium]|nr:SHOCT domain-containing protein [Gaiellaceae bacterium]